MHKGVLELKVPHNVEVTALWPLLPVFVSYVLSFVFVGLYWNNHHHLFQTAEKVNGPVLWANLHLLFWLSLIPFVTGWMGENHFGPWPVSLYGVVLLGAATAYYILVRLLIALHGPSSRLARAVGRDVKGVISMIIYVTAIPLSFVNSWVAYGMYALVAAIWFIPDTRMEKANP